MRKRRRAQSPQSPATPAGSSSLAFARALETLRIDRVGVVATCPEPAANAFAAFLGEFRPHWKSGMISRANVRIMPKNEASSAAKQRRFMASTPALR